jgi:hypothetical protein
VIAPGPGLVPTSGSPDRVTAALAIPHRALEPISPRDPGTPA